jgi:hypothetical protein
VYTNIATKNEEGLRGNPIVEFGMAKKVLTMAKGEMK